MAEQANRNLYSKLGNSCSKKIVAQLTPFPMLILGSGTKPFVALKTKFYVV